MRASRPLAYMVYSLNCIINDMVYFAIVFFIVIAGFAAAFSSLSTNYETPLVTGPWNALQFSYLMATGTFDTTGYDPFTWFIFFVASVLELIILLNLLIAIISDSFANVQSNAVKFTYKQRAETIHNFYLVTRPEELPTPSDRLFVAIRNEYIKSESWLPAKIRAELMDTNEDDQWEQI